MSAVIRFGAERCRDLQFAESREWLVTNGIGGYASGTIAGGMSRRYHALLMAALQPPVGRTQLVAWMDEIVGHGGSEFALATHRWASGAVEPKGFQYIEEFRLEGTMPVWTYALGDARLEKRVWMQQGANTTYVQYQMAQGSGPLEMDLKVLVNYRDFHATTHAGNWRMSIEPITQGMKVVAFASATPFYLRSAKSNCEVRHEWYRDCFFSAERARGLDDREDHLFAALFHAKLQAGESFSVVMSTDATAALDADGARQQRENYESTLTGSAAAGKNGAEAVPEWVPQVVLAADQFIVRRVLPDEPNGRSIIAGYHWFSDWGRDTMIALPGLTLATGRVDAAKQILLAFAGYIDGGMLPNNFPDAAGKPQYNTVDAALWYFEAVRQYFSVTGDKQMLEKLYPVLAGMIDAHLKGTRYQIHVDPADGLLYSGEAGVQLTWMDAKVGDWVVTPRTGKAVEINALWINALETMSGFARLLKKSSEAYDAHSRRAKDAFNKFWNSRRGCCYDVIEAPGIGNDDSLRPNQIFAVALPVSPLGQAQQKAVVDICAERLLTSYGLRSLAPGEPGYQGHYSGAPRERDGAYHQGTVWGWLLGPFARAHFRVYKDQAAAMDFFDPISAAIRLYGVGSLAEIYDGDAPFAPRGCIAQAWSVGEVLRTWTELSRRSKSVGEGETSMTRKTATPV
jgi:predicted glycogen debranching enzyme